MNYLHEERSLAVQDLGPARVAMQVFEPISKGVNSSTVHAVAEGHEDEQREI